MGSTQGPKLAAGAITWAASPARLEKGQPVGSQCVGGGVRSVRPDCQYFCRTCRPRHAAGRELHIPVILICCRKGLSPLAAEMGMGRGLWGAGLLAAVLLLLLLSTATLAADSAVALKPWRLLCDGEAGSAE